ncbi:hypothetical protein [Glycomyces paridis]|uniref:hypothetical protein n=1 Tax=Glycomyces paridis TaxID=2126555 RepID=UPI0013052953|nr:hypothetical protein [Glycomyces paridis]
MSLVHAGCDFFSDDPDAVAGNRVRLDLVLGFGELLLASVELGLKLCKLLFAGVES